MFGANLSYAYAVAVTNASFENQTPTGSWTSNTNGQYNTTVQSWTAGGGGAYGTWKPSMASGNEKFNFIPDGSQVAYFYTDTAGTPRTISQLTGESLTAGYTYTLSAQVGARTNDTPAFTFGGGKIELLAGTTVIGTAVKTAAEVAAGAWGLVQLTVSADAQNPLLLGQQLSIRLSKNTHGTTHSSFDSVSLTAVPLPAAAWLFGSALLGLGWTKRFRRRSRDALIA